MSENSFDNPIAEAEYYRQLMADQYLTMAQVAQRRGVEFNYIHQTMLLLNLPLAVQEYLRSGLMEKRLGRILLELEHLGDQVELAERCLREKMSAAELQQAVEKKFADYN